MAGYDDQVAENPVFQATKEKLDSVGCGMCLAKWTQVTLQLQTGHNHSCHHPKTHKININEIKRRFRRFNQSDKSFFDSISIQLLNYYLNDSIWINKKLFFNKIPSLEYDQSLRISKNNLFYVQEDSLALYLIKINNYKKADDYAPLEYIYNRIKEVIVSKKRIDYLNKIDKELIGDAITKNLYERLD